MWIVDIRGPNIPYPPPPVPVPQASPSIPSPKEMENTFIDALVKACSCRQQSRITSARKSTPTPAFTYHRTRRRNFQSCAKQAHNAPDERQYTLAPSTSLNVSKDEYLQLLDYYREPRTTKELFAGCGGSPRPASSFADTRPREGPTDGSDRLRRVSDEAQQFDQSEAGTKEPDAFATNAGEPDLRSSVFPLDLIDAQGDLIDASLPGPDPLPEHPESHEKVQAIDRFLHTLEDVTSSHGQIYEAYCQLPFPGVSQISDVSRRLLFRRLSVMEIKTKQAMLRYLTLVDDMKEASIPLSLSEWNTAIAFAGRCFARVDAIQVESALHLWKEMENEAGIRSGSVTFNILFDIATKAGKYVLAEMILNEMSARALSYSRFSHVGLIYYHGLRGDGAGIRQAYRDLVEAGQIVDTVVLNCVIASLLRAGELPAAEQVYERMKRLFHAKTGEHVPNRDWRYSRDLGRILDKASRTMRNQPERLRKLQEQQYLAPNMRTFSIFIDYHVQVTGELRRITVMLAEMQDLQIPIHGRIFIKIFRGFARHGGVKYTLWTTQRLEAVWMSLLAASDAQTEGIEVLKWMVVWVIRAFAKCCGSDRTLQIWEEIRNRWKIVDDHERGAVEHLLRPVLRGPWKDDGH